MKPRHLLVALAALPTFAAAQELTPTETQAIDAAVARSLAATGTPSASIAVVRGGRVVLAKAYGKASESIPQARADLPYQIASISKQFTAAAALLLQRDGKVSLDDTVAKYLPGISGGATITVRQLLSHTSGLQDYWPQDYSFAAMEKPTTPQAIVDRWAKKPLDFTPGSQWQYSNTGYVVAGMIVEKVSGEPLLAFLQRRVFKPLGMTAIDQDLAIGPKYPQGYHRYALGPVRVERPAARGWLYAAGELAMSPTDLAKWDIARMNRSLLSPAEWQTQEATIKLTDGKDSHYGLGVFIGDQNGHRMVEHSGEAVGFLSENMVFPDDKAAVVVLTNADFGDAFTTIAADVAKVILATKAMAAGGEESRDADARRTFDMLRSGRIDRTQMTEDANYYFTAEALADYGKSLSALGEPSGFETRGTPRLRGGFVNRNYRVTYPGKTLNIITYAEPGAHGRYEQFLVQPAL